MKNYSHIYFLGIGGIGMSAIARYYTRKGFKVSGYDLTPSQLTAELQAEGIEVHYDDNPSLIPADTASTLIVYTPAIPKELKEYQH
ncbi:MAG TPA: Mur ligase domain-containing protein, partial [Candidatus Cryptobacteroides sp.]|nr:Mur ligase domain-containing protein [Candidatus Cryptobacteroides sp.]